MKLRFLIASGPTQEPLDPVRYLSNYSTGTMGRCLVSAAKKRGHRVVWVQCPKDAESARDLEKKLKSLLPKNDVLVMAAAVADARPRSVSGIKIKKEMLRSIRLVKNPDVLGALSKKKKRSQIFIGFGLESGKLAENGWEKLRKKGLEAIVLQRVSRRDRPFGERAIQALLMEKTGKLVKWSAVTKPRLAGYLVRRAEALFASKRRDSE